ncbi:sugar-transfer associated ATP-grasp domain-containing protein [Patescibacteria group bacterium]
MADWKDILNKNTRNRLFLVTNTKKGRRIADSKIKTKRILKKFGLPVPELLGLFKEMEDVNNFSWEKLEGNFVIKPSRGYAGEGILMIRKRGKWAGEWILMDGRKLRTEDLRFHIADIFAGRYSLKDKPDQAFVEDRIKIHPIFKRYAYRGTPDIRVIVYNRIPVMAMLRLPTAESRGRANVSQGAIGAGIDLATGITTYGVYHNRPVKKVFFSGKKINGLKLPFWDEVLLNSVRAQEVVPGLGYLGIDFVLDKDRGPVILELNARPGLMIQICNQDGLYRRAVRVDGLEVRDADHAVRIAKSLFAERFADKVFARKGIQILKVLEPVKIRIGRKKWVEAKAKIDTGAFRSSIDRSLATKLGLLAVDNILYSRHYSSSMGSRRKRQVIELTFRLGGKRIKTAVSVVNRSHLSTPVLVGRRDLAGFLVKPEPVTTRSGENLSLELEKKRFKIKKKEKK